MRKMKDSGIAWIGEIPTNWTTIKFSSFIERMGTGLNPRDNFVLDKESPFYYVTIRNFKNGKLYLDDNCDRISQEAFNIIQERSQLQAGDFLFASISKEPQVFLLNETPCNWNINESVFCIRPKKGIYLTNYLYYLLTDYRFYESLLTDATGSTFLSIKQNKLKQSTLVLPPNDEQQKIASHLDSKCTQIDSLIANVQQQIEKLKAYKQSLITETVTKGLNPDAPMKDSGIECIGEIPETWDIAPIMRVSNLYNGDRSSNYPSGTDIIDEGIPFITSNNLNSIELDTNISTNKFISEEKYNSLRGAKLKINDIIFCLRGSVGKCGINYKYTAGTIASSLVCIRAKSILSSYLNYVLHTSMIVEQAKLEAIGIGSQNLAAEDIGRVIILIPSKEEQQEIADYLDKKCTQIDSLITIKQQKIEKLQQYKKSLIYEYVTGKREV